MAAKSADVDVERPTPTVGRISSKEARDLVAKKEIPAEPADKGESIRSASNPQKEAIIPGLGSKSLENRPSGQPSDASNLVEALEKAPAELTKMDRMRLEREFRALVKRSGGVRAGLTEEKLARFNRICDLLGRSKEKPVWDKSIKLHGFGGK